MKNLQPVYYHFLSGVICGFHETQSLAQAAADKAEIEHPDPHLPWVTGCFQPGELELQGPGSNVAGFMVGDYWESIVDTSNVPWVKWGNPAMNYTVEIYRVDTEAEVFSATYETIEEACQGRERLLGGEWPWPVGGKVSKS